jgi:hypothetical protein
MGITFLVRTAAGCWKFIALMLLFIAVEVALFAYDGVDGPGEREMFGVTCWAGWI